MEQIKIKMHNDGHFLGGGAKILRLEIFKGGGGDFSSHIFSFQLFLSLIFLVAGRKKSARSLT